MSARPTSSLPGPMKAALWLLSVDEALAADTLKRLDEEEVRALMDTVRDLGKTNSDELAKVHAEFSSIMAEQPLHLRGSAEYLDRLAVKAYGEDGARRLLARVEGPAEKSTDLNKADIDLLSSVLEQEHPQVVAAVVANLGQERGGAVLNRFDDAMRKEVVSRIARLTRVPHKALLQAERLLSAGLPTSSRAETELDGRRVAAGLLNQMEQESSEEILAALENETDTIAQDIRAAMFTFEDLAGLDKRGFQTLLKEIQSDQLMVALKTASTEIQEKIFESLSKRAAEMLREDLEVMGPVRLQDVNDAQAAVVAAALQLKEDGRLTIAGAGDDFV